MAVNYSKLLSQAIQNQLGILNTNIPLPTYPDPPSTRDLEDSQINPKLFAKYLMDPQSYATSSANAAYDSMIATLQAQENGIMPQSAQNQADIQSWFDQTAKTYDQGAAQNQATAAQQSKGLQDASTAMISALGGSANPGSASVASSGLQAMGGLAGVNQANSAFDASMKGIIPLQASQEHVNEKNRAAKLFAELALQIANAQREKGDYYSTKLAEGNQTRFSEQSDLANTIFNQASTLFGAKSDNTKYRADALQQRFTNSLDRKNTNMNSYTSLFNNALAAKSLPFQLAQTVAGIHNTQASTRRLNAQVADINNGNAIDLRDPKQVGQLETSVRAAVSGKGGQFIMDPAQAQKMALNSLKKYGVSGPKATNLVASIFRDILTTSHAHQKWTQYAIGRDGLIHKKHYGAKPGTLFGATAGRPGTH